MSRQRQQQQGQPQLTLKERLAALHNAPSSSSPTSHNPPMSPTSPSSRKMKLPWKRNSQDSSGSPSGFLKPSIFNGLKLPNFDNGHGHEPYGSQHPWSNEHDRAVEERQAVQDAMSRLIFQAGVDYETRPMIVISASALPDPKRVSYDLLLERILSYLHLYVESDYTLVFFAATPPGKSHTPSWNWVWKAYKGLDRKWRKNLKRLLIVHPSFFSKMLFSLAGAFISPKFNQKITYIPTLSILAREVPLTQIDVPSAAYAENTKFEKKIELPADGFGSTGALREGANRLFGTPLEDIMGYDGEKGGVPRVVKDCVRNLREGAMQEEGIFRRSPSTSMLNAARDAYDRGNAISLSEFSRTDPHLSAVLLKKYLRDLPDPIFPEELYALIGRCPYPYFGDNENESTWETIRYIREVLLPEMVPCRAILLSAVLHVLHETSLYSHVNRMDAYNLAIVISPNLVKGSNMMRDVAMCAVQGPSAHPQSHGQTPQRPTQPAAGPPKTTLGTIVKLCIERYYEVFDEVLDRGDAVPVNRTVLRGLEEYDVNHLAEEEPAVSEDEEVEHAVTSSFPPSVADSARRHERRRTEEDEDEEIDDAMLVMPIGPPGHGKNGSVSGVAVSPASSAQSSPKVPPYQPRIARSQPGSRRGSIQARNLQSAAAAFSNSTSSSKLGHRTTLSKSSTSSSGSRGKIAPSSFSYSPSPSSPPSVFSSGTVARSKARSLVSIESGDASSTLPGGLTMRRGSISVGTKGSTIKGKSGASGVEAVGVLAEGFFAAPSTNGSAGGSGSPEVVKSLSERLGKEGLNDVSTTS